MSIKTPHPLFLEYSDDWELCLDSMEQKRIKKKAHLYLPPTSGHILDGFGQGEALGQKAYDAYLARAVYPDTFSEAVLAAIGVMHREEPVFELPPQLEALLTKATKLGEPLSMVLRRINYQQLTTGRVGVLGDLVKNPLTNQMEPVLILYTEKAIINWDDNLIAADTNNFRLVVLDESGYEMGTDFQWVFKERFLVLALTTDSKIESVGKYSVAKANADDTVNSLKFDNPSLMGKNLDRIPFSVINAKDLNPIPDSPPLLSLANQCLTIYRGEADYRHSLFMQGQDTLVKIGSYGNEDDVTRTGAGSSITVPIGGDAKFIGVNSQGLPEQRMALENDYKRAQSKAGQITDATSRAKESGEALRIRVAAQTATLPEIAKAGAAGLEKVLKDLAVWLGADPEKVVVKPNMNFTAEEFQGQTFLQLTQAKAQGAPVSNQTLHNYMRERGLTKLTFEEERDLAETEVPTL